MYNSVKTYEPDWNNHSTGEVKKLHQLSPFIGKLKPKIAEIILAQHTKAGDIVFDPFSGSGTIPLAALYLHRRVLASDISTYSKVLTMGKLFPPPTISAAHEALNSFKDDVELLPSPDLRSVPKWVRSFFHPKTLKETLRWTQVLNKPGLEFYMSCLLGILHHQRPGFLSYPSSHLVPYLRDKKYPRSEFPELYEYREVFPRLVKKVDRALQTVLPPANVDRDFVHQDISKITLPHNVDAIITSPPYMNSLDYVRDNRLRLWFLGSMSKLNKIKEPTDTIKSFEIAMTSLVECANKHLNKNGNFILIMGEIKRKNISFEKYVDSFVNREKLYELTEIISDKIPDIRRARRNCNAIKNEIIFIYKKKV